MEILALGKIRLRADGNQNEMVYLESASCWTAPGKFVGNTAARAMALYDFAPTLTVAREYMRFSIIIANYSAGTNTLAANYPKG